MTTLDSVLTRADALLYEAADGPLAWRLLQAAFAGQARLARSLPRWPVIELPLAVHAGLGGEPEPGEAIATACALFFASADVIDDAQDGDLPTGFDSWQQAVNAGNALIFLSQRVAADAVALRHRAALLAAFSKAGLAMSLGQARDLNQQGELGLTEEAYMKTIRGKAGASFALYASAPAIALGRTKAAEALKRFGMAFGTGLQLASDIRDLMSPDSRDHRNRQVTLPVIAAWEALSADERPLLSASWAQEPGAPALAFLLERSGAQAYAEARLAALRLEAEGALAERAIPNALQRELAGYLPLLTPHAGAVA